MGNRFGVHLELLSKSTCSFDLAKLSPKNIASKVVSLDLLHSTLTHFVSNVLCQGNETTNGCELNCFDKFGTLLYSTALT